MTFSVFFLFFLYFTFSVFYFKKFINSIKKKIKMPETLSESRKKIQIYTCSKVFSNFNFENLRLLLIFKSLYT